MEVAEEEGDARFRVAGSVSDISVEARVVGSKADGTDMESDAAEAEGTVVERAMVDGVVVVVVEDKEQEGGELDKAGTEAVATVTGNRGSEVDGVIVDEADTDGAIDVSVLETDRVETVVLDEDWVELARVAIDVAVGWIFVPSTSWIIVSALTPARMVSNTSPSLFIPFQ